VYTCIPIFIICSLYAVASPGDQVLYASKQRAACRVSAANCTDHAIVKQRITQEKEGYNGVVDLLKMHNYINMTAFAPWAQNIHKDYKTFRAKDCVLI